MQVLVLETSTASVKAMVYDSEEGIKYTVALPYTRKTGNQVIQDTQGVYQELISAGNQAARGCQIEAVALSGIWHGLTVCDTHMRPITPTYTWMYTDPSADIAKLRQECGLISRLYKKTGCMVHSIYPSYRLMYLKQQGLDLKGSRVVCQGSYNFYRLTGDLITTCCMESGRGFLNIHTLCYEEEILSMCGITAAQMPFLGTHRDTRPLQTEAAAALGISPGIPVVPAMADGALNQIGTGAQKQGKMTLSVGTSAAMRIACDRPLIPDQPSTWCYYAANKHLCGAATSGATNCVDWYMKNSHCQSYSQLEAEIKNMENAPVFLPFVFGERCPGWNDERKGGFADLDCSCGAGEQYYAVLEGVLFNLYHCFLKLMELQEHPSQIFVSGGICHSELWLSMLADIFQKDISLTHSSQASLQGGGVVALVAAGQMVSVEDFCVETARTIKPDNSKKEFYQKRFARYMELYNLLS